MNPVVALSTFVPNIDPKTCSDEDLLSVWSTVDHFTLPNHDNRVYGRGIRAILKAIFESQSSCIESVWLPRDVYPIYWELAEDLHCQPFETLPGLNLEFLSTCGPNDFILLPAPLSPLGRPLTAEECQRLHDWLEEAPGRHLLIDTVYDFGVFSEQIVEHDRSIVIRSVSKSWIARQVLGVANVPPSWTQGVQKNLQELDSQECEKLYALMSSTLDFGPSRLQTLFETEWNHIQASISEFFPEWKPPSTGYFSLLPANHLTLFTERNIMAVPATVFGSAHDDFSLITCLHDLTAHHHLSV